MFKLTSVQVRSYEFEDPDDGSVLHILPPKLETMEIFSKVFTDTNAAPKDLAGIVGAVISDNEEKKRITAKQVMRWMNTDQLAAFVDDFLGWVNGTKASNPN